MKITITRDCERNVETVTIDDGGIKDMLQKVLDQGAKIEAAIHRLDAKLDKMKSSERVEKELTDQLRKSGEALENAVAENTAVETEQTNQ